VATYLLASGEFSRRISDSATLATLGTDHPSRMCVSDPLGAHDQVARLVLRRYDAALAAPPLNLADEPSDA
jgi:sirohydrochlorin ferrochelatase